MLIDAGDGDVDGDFEVVKVVGRGVIDRVRGGLVSR